MKNSLVAALIVSTVLPLVWASSPALFARPAAAPDSGSQDDTPATVCHVTVEIPMQPLARYAEHSTDIVHAIVGSVSNDATGLGLPLTVYRVAVIDSLKGVAASEIDVRVAGGVAADGTEVIVDRAPRFEPGDEVVLFLTRADEQDPFGVLGLSDGVYSVSFNAEGAQVVTGLHAANESPTAFLERVLTTWIEVESR